MDQALLQQLLHRPSSANKYDFGHVLIVGGSPGMVGAPLLAAEAALRIGAGLVTIAAPADVTDKLERRVKEVMTLALPAEANEALQQLDDFIAKRHVATVVLGPGQTAAMATLDHQLLSHLQLPVVVDAGALAALKNHTNESAIGNVHPNVIITPHTGEFQRLTDERVPSDPTLRQKIAADFATTHRVTLVLKGHHTLIAQPNGNVHENTTGNPGLATAGTGDVLSGVIAGLLAQGLPTAQAAMLGVYLHGLAGDLAAAAKTEAGMIASDVIEQLPAAIRKAA